MAMADSECCSATIWQAVVLLDEADVFLEARTDNSSDRNALVASKFATSLWQFSFVLVIQPAPLFHFTLPGTFRNYVLILTPPGSIPEGTRVF